MRPIHLTIIENRMKKARPPSHEIMSSMTNKKTDTLTDSYISDISTCTLTSQRTWHFQVNNWNRGVETRCFNQGAAISSGVTSTLSGGSPQAPLAPGLIRLVWHPLWLQNIEGASHPPFELWAYMNIVLPLSDEDVLSTWRLVLIER